MEKIGEVFDNLGDYGAIILHSVYVLVIGVVVVLALQWLAAKYIYPHIKRRRLLRVVFGTLYALTVAASFLLALDNLGYDVEAIARLTLLLVLAGALISLLLSPYMPSLPFKIGNMVEIEGMVGIVDTITPFHTRIQTLDGKSIFFPNTKVIYTSIINYHFTPTRRIELQGMVDHTSDIDTAIQLLLEIMHDDPRVLDDPEPKALVKDVTPHGVKLAAMCWVANADWLLTKSDLWRAALAAFSRREDLSMALPKQEVHLVGRDTTD